MTKVILTGGTGFIGQHALHYLLDRGHEIHVLSSKKSHGMNGAIWHQQDLMDFAGTRDFVKKIQATHLLHLAWTVKPGQFWTSVENLSWVQCSLNLIRAFQESGGRRIVAAGTCGEYDWNGDIFDEKTSQFCPATLYGASKRGLYLISEAFAHSKNLSFAWGYVFHLYGPGENPNRFLPSIIRGLLQKKIIPCSHGDQIRDFLHVSDVARAFVSLLESSLIGGVNIGSGNEISLKKLARMVADQIGGHELLHFGALATPFNEPLRLVPEVKRLHKELNWAANQSISQGLEEVISWWKRNL